jgi:hypothetical protein
MLVNDRNRPQVPWSLASRGTPPGARPPARRRVWYAVAIGCASVLLAGSASAADPTKDQCIDANEASQAMRKAEKLHDAEQKLLVCVSASCPGPVRDDCAQRLTEVRAATPTVVFVVKDDADQDLTDVHVTIDGQPLTDKLDGLAIPIDPGPHRFAFASSGRTKEERALVIREGEKDRHERVVLVSAATPPAAAANATVPEAAPTAAEAPARDGKGQRIAGIAVGGAGVVGLVVGSVLGLASNSKYKDAVTHCPVGQPSMCDPTGVDEGQSAHSEAAASTVVFVVSAAFVAGGALLYFTAPKSNVTVTPTVGAQSAGLAVGGRW